MTTEQTEIHPGEYTSVGIETIRDFRQAQENFPRLRALLETMLNFSNNSMAGTYGLEEYPTDDKPAKILTGRGSVTFRLTVVPTNSHTPDRTREIRKSTLDIYTAPIAELVITGWKGRAGKSPLFLSIESRDIQTMYLDDGDDTTKEYDGHSEFVLYARKFSGGIRLLGHILNFADLALSEVSLRQFATRLGKNAQDKTNLYL